eukprot:1193229-Prorocentrum_minimum.AAC.1
MCELRSRLCVNSVTYNFFKGPPVPVTARRAQHPTPRSIYLWKQHCPWLPEAVVPDKSNQSDAESAGIFSRWTNQMQEMRVYSHNRIRRRRDPVKVRLDTDTFVDKPRSRQPEMDLVNTVDNVYALHIRGNVNVRNTERTERG